MEVSDAIQGFFERQYRIHDVIKKSEEQIDNGEGIIARYSLIKNGNIVKYTL